MINKIDFYFDIISPYSYLAHKRIIKIDKSNNVNFFYKPILLGGLHNLLKITAPAFVKNKNKYLIDDCNMVAKKFNIKFKFNDKFPINSLHIMRGLLVIDEDKKVDYVDKFFNAYWRDNIDLSNNDEFKKILKKLSINEDKFFLKIKKEKIKILLKQFTQSAFDKKLFGAPTFVVNNKIFWGQDRLEYALDEFNS